TSWAPRRTSTEGRAGLEHGTSSAASTTPATRTGSTRPTPPPSTRPSRTIPRSRRPSSTSAATPPTTPRTPTSPPSPPPSVAPAVVPIGPSVWGAPTRPLFSNPPCWTAVPTALIKGGRAYLSWIGVFPKRIADKEVLYTGANDGGVAVSSRVDGSGVAAWNV